MQENIYLTYVMAVRNNRGTKSQETYRKQKVKWQI